MAADPPLASGPGGAAAGETAHAGRRLLAGGAAHVPPEAGDRRWFEYHAVRKDGARLEGRELARSLPELEQALEARGLLLLGAQEARRRPRPWQCRLKRAQLVALTSQLATMLAAGIPILQALREIERRSRSRAVRREMAEIVDDLQAGTSLADSLDRRPRSFPPIYRATVRAGERSATLPDVLARQARTLSWIGEIRSMTVQALIYPAILSLAVLGLITILVTLLVPRLVTLYPGGAADLPRETRLLMQVSSFVVGNLALLAGGLGSALLALALLARREGARLAGSRLLLALPRLGELLRMIATSRFAHTAGMLHESGCEVVQTLRLAGDTCGSTYLARAFRRATERVRCGATIAESLEREPGIDPFLVQLVAVGETSGDLGQSLAHLTRAYDEEVPRAVRRALALVEPAVLVIGGGVVLLVLLAALLPILTLYETL